MNIKQKQLIESYIRQRVKKLLDEKREVLHAEAQEIYSNLKSIKNEMGIFPSNVKNDIVKMLDKIEKYTDKYGTYDIDETR